MDARARGAGLLAFGARTRRNRGAKNARVAGAVPGVGTCNPESESCTLASRRDGICIRVNGVYARSIRPTLLESECSCTLRSDGRSHLRRYSCEAPCIISTNGYDTIETMKQQMGAGAYS
jgi:hypothetical protein